MISTCKYTAKKPNKDGYIDFTAEENSVWHDLFIRQQKIIAHRASKEFLAGVAALHMAADHIPQLPEMNQRLMQKTGWQVEAVDALISNELFFELLAHKRFPAATFIRYREELDYLHEPDIFHEYFGHCPMLTDPIYANFTQDYAKLYQKLSIEDRRYLGRLYWFTIEFGLVNTEDGLRIYGGGILSSKSESIYALESDLPLRLPFDGLNAMRTPYRIDIMQPIYFCINDYQDLYNIMNGDIVGLIHQAQDLGDYPARFELDESKTY